MISIYEYKDYKKFVLALVKSKGSEARGFYTKLSELLGTSNAAISQIFNGDREMNLEQAVEFGEWIGLGAEEIDFLILLVEKNRAGSVKLRNKFESLIEKELKKQRNLSNRVAKDVKLNESQRAVYYSSWIYTGLRNLVATEPSITIEEISKRLNITILKTREVLQFLVENQLIVIEKSKMKIGPLKTHLENNSPWITKHHHNWRIKSIERIPSETEADLFYSAPMSLSKDLAIKIRERLPEFIKQIVNEVGESPSEVVRCLNIDWFEY